MAPLTPAALRELEEGLLSGAIATKADLQRAKRRAAGRGPLPADRDVAAHLGPGARQRHAGLLRTKPTRSRSGVAVVAVMSSPAACPHGKCTFCPGGPDVGVPQSYTGFEPSTMRAARLGYDPCRTVRSRLGQLARNGHPVGKIDVVVQGGTFPAREPAYQDWFVAGVYAGCNGGPDAVGSADDAGGADARDGADAWEPEEAWRPMPEAERTTRLAALMRANEQAPCRVVGLTIETKPDWCLEPHVDGMLRLGATRVEVGLQALDDGVLAATHRGHTLRDSEDALRVARDAGLKVSVHMMPGLPRPVSAVSAATADDADASKMGSLHLHHRTPHGGTRPGHDEEDARRGSPGPSGPSAVPPEAWPPRQGTLDPDPEADVEDFRRLFSDPAWRPDMLKVYPTLVVREGETLLKRQWRRGEYHPYDTATAARLVARAKSFVPEWCRIQRIDRDIPTTHVEAGVMHSNLRQLAQQERRRLGLPPCRCIRCREAGRRGGAAAGAGEAVLVRREYEAGGGQEAFLAFEDPAADAVLAFLRLRRAGPAAHRPELRAPGGAALVRELKAHGTAADVGAGPPPGSWQHRGLGGRLLAAAESIAFSEWRVGRILVLAGPGVKPYYRRRGYVDCGPYVAKEGPRELHP